MDFVLSPLLFRIDLFWKDIAAWAKELLLIPPDCEKRSAAEGSVAFASRSIWMELSLSVTLSKCLFWTYPILFRFGCVLKPSKSWSSNLVGEIFWFCDYTELPPIPTGVLAVSSYELLRRRSYRISDSSGWSWLRTLSELKPSSAIYRCDMVFPIGDKRSFFYSSWLL